jgi:hypothetical protein
MAKVITFVDVSSFTTDAKFRTWGLAMSTAMQAAGFVKTADTGQINWVTVTKPVATNTQAGYEIYRFDDDLQATAPIFFRVGYGSGGTASGNSPATWITIGTATDGAGTISGIGSSLGALQGYNVSVTPNNTTMPGYFCHSPGYGFMHFGGNLNTSSNGPSAGIWMICRTGDGSGGYSSTGAALYRIFYTNSASHHYGLNYSTGFVNIARNIAAGLISTSTVSGADSLPLAKHYILNPTPQENDALLSYPETDVAHLSEFSADPFGVTHTYLSFADTFAFMDSSATSTTAGAVKWIDTAP